jgi:hypothetical protein
MGDWHGSLVCQTVRMKIGVFSDNAGLLPPAIGMVMTTAALETGLPVRWIGN